MLRKCQRALGLLLALAALSACQSPTQSVIDIGDRAGFSRQTVRAKGFDMMLMAPQPSATDYLHVYLEGDGMPWRKPTVMASDPTSGIVLMLDLMALDSNDSVYIGRPCYNGTALEPECDNRMWTSARYSTTVVDSMVSALNQYLAQHNYRYIRLFGHSGGGALAMLLAEQFNQTTDVLTIAGNLDINAWTSHHGYTPLYSSLNPSDRPALSQNIRQWHWTGAKDRVIPPALVAPFIQSQANAFSSTVLSFNHSCCWKTIWQEMLAKLRAQQVRAMPGETVKMPQPDQTGVDGLPWKPWLN